MKRKRPEISTPVVILNFLGAAFAAIIGVLAEELFFSSSATEPPLPEVLPGSSGGGGVWNHVFNIFSFIIGCIGVYFGWIIVRVGIGKYGWSRRRGFYRHDIQGRWKKIEMILGFLLALSGLVALALAPFGMMLKGMPPPVIVLLVFSLVLIAGFIRFHRVERIVVVRNWNKTGLWSPFLGVLILWVLLLALLVSQTRTAQSSSSNNSPPDDSTVSPTERVPPTVLATGLAVEFRDLQDGQEVEQTIPFINGTHKNVPDGSEIWVVVKTGTTCFPMSGPAIRESTGVWRHGEVTFPERGKPYELTLIIANTEASPLLRSAVAKPTGLPCSQPGSRIVETLFVMVEQ